jgi:hypothetical protein
MTSGFRGRPLAVIPDKEAAFGPTSPNAVIPVSQFVVASRGVLVNFFREKMRIGPTLRLAMSAAGPGSTTDHPARDGPCCAWNPDLRHVHPSGAAVLSDVLDEDDFNRRNSGLPSRRFG